MHTLYSAYTGRISVFSLCGLTWEVVWNTSNSKSEPRNYTPSCTKYPPHRPHPGRSLSQSAAMRMEDRGCVSYQQSLVLYLWVRSIETVRSRLRSVGTMPCDGADLPPQQSECFVLRSILALEQVPKGSLKKYRPFEYGNSDDPPRRNDRQCVSQYSSVGYNPSVSFECSFIPLQTQM